MDKSTIAVVNVSDSHNEFALGVYMCPNNKKYTFAQNFQYIAGWNKGTVEYIGKVSARGVVKIKDGKYSISEKRCDIGKIDTIDQQFFNMFDKAVENSYYRVNKKDLGEGVQIFFFEQKKHINAVYSQGSGVWSKMYMNVHSTKQINIDLLAEKLSGKDLNDLNRNKINIDSLQSNRAKEIVNQWVIPCNLDYYDIDSAFNDLKEIEWTQKINDMRVEDIVYIYISKPNSKIEYKCIVTAVNLDKATIDDTAYIKDETKFQENSKLFRIKLIKKVLSNNLKLETLQHHGLDGVIQNQRKLNEKIAKFVNDEFETANGLDTTSIDDKKIISDCTEEEMELFLNATDVVNGYTFQQKLVKIRASNQKVLKSLIDKYSGQCQLCGVRAGQDYDVNIVEGHHIEHYCVSQNNSIDNLILLCPNCHRLMHKLTVNFIKERSSFIINGKEVKIKIPGHLSTGSKH